MPALPLKVQVGIRDHWSKEDGRLQTALKGLRETIGHEVVVEPEWPLLLAELDGVYPDKGNFVAAVAGCVETWCKSMGELLDDEANEEWTDSLLERLKAWSRLRLYVEVSGGADKDVATSWAEQRNAFVISLPKKVAVVSPAQFYPVFRAELLHCFNPEKKKSAAAPASSAAASSVLLRESAAADDWADVGLDRSTGTPAVIEKAAPPVSAARLAVRPKTEMLPAASSLPRPDDLLLKPPYHLMVYDMGRQKIEVHCSHSASLQLLADYLKRWCRTNHNDTRNPPAVDVILDQSPWGLGLMYDRLLLSTEENRYIKQFSVNPCIVLALVEAVLGYDQVSVHAGQWTYRRNVEFR